MDISIVGNQSIKLKGKQVTFIVGPVKEMPKVSADAIIFLDGNRDKDTSRVTDSRIIIDGPGGYEVGGAKISGTRTPKGILYRLSIDGINVILGRSAEPKDEGFSSCQVLIVDSDSDFNESFVTALEPKITVLYGDKKVEAAKALGSQNVSSTSKLTIMKDKLPEKMEIVVLG